MRFDNIEERKKALAQFLEIDVNKIKEMKYDLYGIPTFSVDETKEEYAVADSEEEVERACKEDVSDLLEEVGISVFHINLEQFVDEGWFEDACREHILYYIDDMREENSDYDDFENRLEEEMANAGCDTEEDFAEYLYDAWTDNDPIDWYISNFGKENFNETCEKYNLIDVDKLAEYVYNMDGAGNCLARYDGKEFTEEYEGQDYYIYRIN